MQSKFVESSGMDPGGRMGGCIPPPPDPRLVKGMLKVHAQFAENESKMLKIMHHPLPLEISGSTPGKDTLMYNKLANYFFLKFSVASGSIS